MNSDRMTVVVAKTVKDKVIGGTKKTKKKRGLKYLLTHPLSFFRKTDVRVDSFMRLIETHIEFFNACPQIDSYLIAMAFVYLQRAQPSIPPNEYTPELLFCCLYLAWVIILLFSLSLSRFSLSILCRKQKKIQQLAWKELFTMWWANILVPYMVGLCNDAHRSVSLDYGNSQALNLKG